MSGAATEKSGAGRLALALAALLVLAGVSLAFRFAHLGATGLPVALGIAVVKAALVLIFFMEIGVERPTVRFACAAGVAMLCVMLALVVADIVTRTVPPLADPPGTEPRAQG
ncbi:MAG TPA: cytochrome C oxidase subunit IV family protein [Polyangiaceae bacterium]